jgi:hypothetical protein
MTVGFVIDHPAVCLLLLLLLLLLVVVVVVVVVLLLGGNLGTFRPSYKNMQNVQAVPNFTRVPTGVFCTKLPYEHEKCLILVVKLLIRYRIVSKSRSAVQECNVDRQT